MESGDETNTSISNSSQDTIDIRSLVTAQPSPSLLSQYLSQSSSLPPIDSLSPTIPSSLSPAIMATEVKNPGGHEVSTNFTMNTYASVTTLATGTFNDWKLRLTTVMGAHRLSKFILRDVIAPEDPKSLDDHETNSMRAIAAIHATIDNENFEVIRHCSNPRDAYLKLCKHHDDAGGLSTANLFSDLVTLKLTSDGDLKDHIHQFRKVHNDLLSNLLSTPDMKISEPFVAIILINSLPTEYTPLVQSLLTSFETLSLARLYSLLNIEATRNSSTSKGESALSVNRANGSKKFKKKDSYSQPTSKDTIVCSLGHAGHTDENCKTKQWREFKAYQESKSKDAAKLTRDEPLNLINEPDADISYYDTAFSATITKLPTVMDTGASSHMFGEKNAFSSMRSTPPSTIAVASKDGSIYSGHRGCVIIGCLTLKDVLYSNELTGNLISIGRLCDDGYTAVFR